MSLVEIEKQIRVLSNIEKIQLIQNIAQMLKEQSTTEPLHELARVVDPGHTGPLEAYEAAKQLQNLLNQEKV